MDKAFLTAAEKRREKRKIEVLKYLDDYNSLNGKRYEIVKQLAKRHRCHENTIRNIFIKGNHKTETV